MAQPISLGTVLGGRYVVLDEVQTTAEGDHVLGGKDQILGREVTILVPSEAHTSRVVENARTMAIGAVDADLHILDLGQSGATPYLVTSFAAPAVLLSELLADPGTIDDDTLSDDLFGRPRSSGGSSQYVVDDGEPTAPQYEDTAEEDYGRWGEDDISSAPAAPKVERRLGRPRRAPEESTRATLFDRAAAGHGAGPQQRPQSSDRVIDPSYDGDNRYDSYESYEHDRRKAPTGGPRPQGGDGRTRHQRRSLGSSRAAGAAGAAGAGAAAGGGSSPARGGSSGARTSSGAGSKSRLGLLLLLLTLVLLLGAGIIFGGLGRIFDSGRVFGPTQDPTTASPTQQPVAAPANVTRLVPDQPTLMADQDGTLTQTIDGDPATSWVSYGFSGPDYGQLVSSTALAVRFEEPTPMNELTIVQDSGSGGAFTVHAADSPALDGAVEVGQGTFDGPETTVELSEEASADDHEYLIVQWTELPSLEQPIAGYDYGLRIAELEVS